MKLVVGLGNPGLKYEKTRHNVGFRVIDMLSQETGISVNRSKFKGLMGKGLIEGEDVILLKPLTYMNLSGESVREAMNFFKIEPEDLIVICDDIDIPFGTIRIKGRGSAGTHNGLKSIIGQIGSQNFPRIRISVGQKPPYMDLAAFVLSSFSPEEEQVLHFELKNGRDGVLSILEKGLQKTMSQFNGLKYEKNEE